MLISFSGAQSTGKTTLLNECKKQFPNYNYVDEVTRKLQKQGFKINEQGDNLTQLYILNEHLQNIRLENAVLDRCILDGLIYTRYLNEQKKVSDWVYKYAAHLYEELISKYDLIFYTDHNIPLIDDGVRSINHEFRDRIIQLFEMYVYLIPVVKNKVVIVTGTVEERMETIKKYLK